MTYRMRKANKLTAALDHIAAGDLSGEAMDALRRAMRGVDKDVLMALQQALSTGGEVQLGKYVVNIGEAGNIHVGDEYVIEGDEAAALRQALQDAISNVVVWQANITRLIVVAASSVVLLAVFALMRGPQIVSSLVGPPLVPFTHPALVPLGGIPVGPEGNIWLRDVVARNGYVWFATRDGLVLHTASDGNTRSVEAVPEPVEALAINGEGDAVWFSLSDGRVGHYTAGEKVAEIFTPATAGEQQPLSTEVLSILPAPDGTVWFGDIFNGLFRYTDGVWQAVQMPPPPPTLIRVEEMALGPADPSVLWVTDGLFIFRWQDGEWLHLDSLTTGGELPIESMNAILGDAYNHIWFAHSVGVSVLAKGATSGDQRDYEWRTCTSSESPLPPGQVLSLASSDDGHVVWLATEGGLARVSVDQEMPPNCRDWRWQVWSAKPELKDFWALGSEIRLAVDEDPERDETTVWLINRQAGRVLALETR